jgi:hypothetical protein
MIACEKKDHYRLAPPANPPANQLIGTWYEQPDNEDAITFNDDNTFNFITIASYDNATVTIYDYTYTKSDNPYELEGTWNSQFSGTIVFDDSRYSSTHTRANAGTYSLYNTTLYLISDPVEYTYNGGLLTYYSSWSQWEDYSINGDKLTFSGKEFTLLGSGSGITGTWNYERGTGWPNTITYTFTSDNRFTYLDMSKYYDRVFSFNSYEGEYKTSLGQISMRRKTVSRLESVADDSFSSYETNRQHKLYYEFSGKDPYFGEILILGTEPYARLSRTGPKNIYGTWGDLWDYASRYYTFLTNGEYLITNVIHYWDKDDKRKTITSTEHGIFSIEGDYIIFQKGMYMVKGEPIP